MNECPWLVHMLQLDKLMSYGIRSYISCFVCHLALVIESADHITEGSLKSDGYTFNVRDQLQDFFRKHCEGAMRV
jgi:hypothetical protein